MRIASQHRLDSMPGDLGKIRVIDAGNSQMRDVAMAALVGADVGTARNRQDAAGTPIRS